MVGVGLRIMKSLSSPALVIGSSNKEHEDSKSVPVNRKIPKNTKKHP